MAIKPPVAAPAQESPPDPDHERMLTVMEHLTELRYRAIVMAIALVIGVCVSVWPLTGWFIDFLSEPGHEHVENFELVFTEPLEYWTVYFRVSLLLGIAIAMPVIVYQVFAFIGPGLSRGERRWVYPIVIGATASFLAGAAFAYYVILPPSLSFLIESPGDISEDVSPFIKIKSYIDFVTRLMLVTGLVFEMPLIIMGLAKVGVVTSRKLIGWWRYAIVGAFVVAAIVTPSIDPITQAFVAGPIIVLYFLGILLAKLVEGSPLIPR
jgi:sec-independent protein translocase protein TatC